MKYAFVINPAAGKQKVQEPFARAVQEYFAQNGGDYEIYYTAAPGDAKAYANRLAQSGEAFRIYACGGEGTAFEVLNGIVGFPNVSLGVVPCGSANDFISYFSNREIFLDLPAQIAGEALEIDLIRVGEYYALNSCSIGLDAMVAANMSKFKSWPLVSGKMAYVLALLYTLFGKLSVGLTVSVDQGREVIRQKSLVAVVANAPYYGGGFYPAPFAKPFDGTLDYSVIAKVSRLKILSLLKAYRAGTHIHHDLCKYGVCKRISIVADRTVPLNMDGEIIYIKEADFEIVPKACRLILPRTISTVWRERAAEKQVAEIDN